MEARELQILTAAVGILLFLAAAWRDFATRTIPDKISIVLALIGLAARATAGPMAVSVSMAAGVALFLLLLVAHAKGALGGGDVKLMAAAACGLSPPEIYHFILVTGISGGVLAAIHLALRRMTKDFRPMQPPPKGAAALSRILAAERWRIARRGPLPYGIAIACGGIATLGPRLSW